MKITKSKLAQIVQEELAAIKSEGYDAGQAVWMEKFKLHARVPQNQELSDEMKNNAQDAFRQGMDPAQAAKELSAIKAEGYKAYKRDDMSPHAKDLTKNKKKGYSAQAAASAIPDNEEVDKAYHKSLNKKPKRGLDEAGKGTDALESHMLGREHALAVSKGEMAMEDTWERQLSNKDYERGFDEQTKELDPQANWDDERVSDPEGGDDDWMWENKITKSKLAQIVQEELAAVDIEEGMMDMIKNKLSPKRPAAAKAPRKRRERNEHEKKLARQQGGADAYDFNLGMLERPNRPNDEDYMAGWNDTIQEGTNKMKITKSQLAQIIKEELKATLSESYALYDDLEDWALEALVELGGEQPAGEIAAKAFEEWSLNAHHNTEVGDEDPDHSVTEEDWSDSIDVALQSLVDDGRVRRAQREPGSTNEDFYALVQ